LYSQVINYIKQKVEFSREEIEEDLKYSDFRKYAKGDYLTPAAGSLWYAGSLLFLNK